MSFRERLEQAAKRGREADPLTLADVDKLTENQRRVLGEISIGNDGGHAEKTILALIAKGWIVMVPEQRRLLTVYRYEMPIAAHMVWCEWCAANVKEEM